MHTTVETRVNENGRFLQQMLRGNAIFSIIFGLVFIFAGGAFAELTGLQTPWAFTAVGVALLPFAYFVWHAASQLSSARIIIALDLVWVVGSYLFLWQLWQTLTPAGRWFVALQAEAVFLFDVFQIIGFRRLSR